MDIMTTIGAATGGLSLAILGLLYRIKQLEARIEKLEKEECLCACGEKTNL